VFGTVTHRYTVEHHNKVVCRDTFFAGYLGRRWTGANIRKSGADRYSPRQAKPGTAAYLATHSVDHRGNLISTSRVQCASALTADKTSTCPLQRRALRPKHTDHTVAHASPRWDL
jgi:hypothetical protein